MNEKRTGVTGKEALLYSQLVRSSTSGSSRLSLCTKELNGFSAGTEKDLETAFS